MSFTAANLSSTYLLQKDGSLFSLSSFSSIKHINKRHSTLLSSIFILNCFSTPTSSGETRIILQLWMTYRSCKTRLKKLSSICLPMLHPLMLLNSLSWSTLHHRRLVHRYINTFKYICGLVDHGFNILRNSDIHGYNTRKKKDFNLPLVNKNYGKHRLLYKII